MNFLKKALFGALLGLISLTCYAQSPVLIGVQASQVVGEILKDKRTKVTSKKVSIPQSYERYVTYINFGNERVPFKRIPDDKLKGEDKNLIIEIQKNLSNAHYIILSGQLDNLEATIKPIEGLISNLTYRKPKFPVWAYQDELRFYQQTQRSYDFKKLQIIFEKEKQLQIVASRRKDSLNQIVWKQAQKERSASAYYSAAPIRKKKVTKSRQVQQGSSQIQNQYQPGNVFVCNSGNKVKYHNSSYCRGLKRCKSAIKQMTQSSAQSFMDACKLCY